MDRRTATLMYASRNRSKAIRGWLPQNRGARDIVTWNDGGPNAGEDRICCGGAPARRGGFAQTRRRSRVERGEDHGGQTSATISAQRNPASSRAMAAATTERTSCGRPIVGSAWTSGPARPTSGPRSRVAHLLGVHECRRRCWGCAGRPRPLHRVGRADGRCRPG